MIALKSAQIKEEHDSWRQLFDAQYEKDKGFLNSLDLVVKSMSIMSGSTTGNTASVSTTTTSSTGTSTLPGKNYTPPTGKILDRKDLVKDDKGRVSLGIPTGPRTSTSPLSIDPNLNLGTEEYEGKIFDLNKLRDAVDKQDRFGTKSAGGSLVALYQHLLYKKFSNGKINIPPGILYGQNEIESGGGLHSSDPDTVAWYKQGNLGGQHAANSEDPNLLAREKSGRINKGSSTGLPFFRYNSISARFVSSP